MVISDSVTNDDDDDDDIQTVSEGGPGLRRRLGAAALQCRHLQQPFQGDGEWVSSEQSIAWRDTRKWQHCLERIPKQKFK